MSKLMFGSRRSSSAAVKYVIECDDVLLQILVRLPARSLIKFKLVSKHWHSLISDSQFVQSHVTRIPNTSPSGLFLYESKFHDFFWLTPKDKERRVTPSLAFLSKLVPKGYDVRILQCCNGLLLCSSGNSKKDRLEWEDLLICNPSTKQYKFLPRLEDPVGGKKIGGFGLAFNPRISLDYKVIYVQHLFVRPRATKFAKGIDRVGSHCVVRVQIYSSDKQSWRIGYEFRDPCPSVVYSGTDGLVWDGGVHWIGCYSFHYDLKSDTLSRGKSPPPSGLRDESYDGCGVTGEYSYYFNQSHHQVYVTKVSEDYSRWIFKYKISLGHLTSQFPDIRYHNFCALAVVEGPKEEDSALVLAVPGKVISYNFVKKTVEVLGDLGQHRTVRNADAMVYPFVETLYSV